MFGIDANRPWPRRPLAPLQGAGNVWIAVPQGIGRRWLPQPWALLFRPVGPMDHAPNGGQDLSPGLSEAMPWDLTPQHVMRPEGARESADGGEGVEK